MRVQTTVVRAASPAMVVVLVMVLMRVSSCRAGICASFQGCRLSVRNALHLVMFLLARTARKKLERMEQEATVAEEHLKALVDSLWASRKSDYQALLGSVGKLADSGERTRECGERGLGERVCSDGVGECGCLARDERFECL